jgi:hypothetical protein
MMKITRLGPFLAVFSVVLAAPFAQAAGNEGAERAARKACLSGDYATGVGILSDRFIDTKDPTYIYNQARCFEQNNRCEDAIGRFREYLRLATQLPPADRAATEKHIADCQALLGPKVAPEPVPQGALEPIPRPGTSPAAAAAIQPPTVPQADVASGAAPVANPGRGLRIAGIACGVLGLAAVGTGIYYYTQARSYSDKVSAQPIHNPSDDSAGKHAQTMQWVFYGAGAAAIATGTVLYVLGRAPADASRATTAIAPMLGPGLAGVSAQGAF